MRIVLKWLLPTSLGALVLCVACGGSSTGLVDNAPHFTAQPASQTVYSGATAAFTVAANGYPAPTFTWERSNDAGATWTPIAGATSSSYGFTVQSTDTDAVFRAVATNSVASTNSLPATLTKVPAVYAAG
ncbi:MAG: immunoglobulin domain-containing protein, partial [Geothrix sp.]|nr:immunoglobulin domain-containing protein [Geothrix sp.]